MASCPRMLSQGQHRRAAHGRGRIATRHRQRDARPRCLDALLLEHFLALAVEHAQRESLQPSAQRSLVAVVDGHRFDRQLRAQVDFPPGLAACSPRCASVRRRHTRRSCCRRSRARRRRRSRCSFARPCRRGPRCVRRSCTSTSARVKRAARWQLDPHVAAQRARRRRPKPATAAIRQQRLDLAIQARPQAGVGHQRHCFDKVAQAARPSASPGSRPGRPTCRHSPATPNRSAAPPAAARWPSFSSSARGRPARWRRARSAAAPDRTPGSGRPGPTACRPFGSRG